MTFEALISARRLTQTIAVQQDIHNIHSILVRHDARLQRIERRLEIAEPA
jgi:hypothetical protein